VGGESQIQGQGVTRVAAVCLIYEVNCYLSGAPEPSAAPRRGWWRSLVLPPADPSPRTPPGPQSYGSVWIMPRALGPEDDYETVAQKVVGPIPSDQAEAALTALRSVLEAAGVQVTDETVSDD
jgi:hypothetical protein